MRLDIRYRMSFSYDAPVWEAQNEIRVRPRDDDHQRVISHRLTTAPAARVLTFHDYWGTAVDHVGVRDPHMALELVAEAAVETMHREPFEGDAALGDLADNGFVLGHVEYLAPSAHTRWNDDIVALAADTAHDAASVREEIDAVIDMVHGLLRYESESTDIGIEPAELVKLGRGVCQDFAHLTITVLRCRGVPARYVSGYLFARDETRLDADAPGDDVVRVQTHAWVEAAVPGHGWYAVDPTNRQPVLDRHVVIGHGRDYDDVAPVRGVFSGTAIPSVDAEVVIARMAPAARSVFSDAPRRLDADQMAAHRRQMIEHQQQQQQQQ